MTRFLQIRLLRPFVAEADAVVVHAKHDHHLAGEVILLPQHEPQLVVRVENLALFAPRLLPFLRERAVLGRRDGEIAVERRCVDQQKAEPRLADQFSPPNRETRVGRYAVAERERRPSDAAIGRSDRLVLSCPGANSFGSETSETTLIAAKQKLNSSRVMSIHAMHVSNGWSMRLSGGFAFEQNRFLRFQQLRSAPRHAAAKPVEALPEHVRKIGRVEAGDRRAEEFGGRLDVDRADRDVLADAEIAFPTGADRADGGRARGADEGRGLGFSSRRRAATSAGRRRSWGR